MSHLYELDKRRRERKIGVIVRAVKEGRIEYDDLVISPELRDPEFDHDDTQCIYCGARKALDKEGYQAGQPKEGEHEREEVMVAARAIVLLTRSIELNISPGKLHVNAFNEIQHIRDLTEAFIKAISE